MYHFVRVRSNIVHFRTKKEALGKASFIRKYRVTKLGILYTQKIGKVLGKNHICLSLPLFCNYNTFLIFSVTICPSNN